MIEERNMWKLSFIALLALSASIVSSDDIFLKDEEKLVNATTKFALSLSKTLIPLSKTGNVIFSPLSIFMGLGMTYLGTCGETKDQMKDVMFLNFSRRIMEKASESLLDIVNSGTREGTLVIDNRIYADTTVKPSPRYLLGLEKYLKSELVNVDFKHNAMGAVKQINDWVATTTNHKIPNILQPKDVDSQTMMCLISAIYFKANWSQQFDISSTHNDTFYLTPTRRMQVPLMHMSGKSFNYGVNTQLNCQAIELAFHGGASSMFIILPSSPTTLDEVDSKMTFDDFANIEIMFSMKKTTISDLFLPRLRLESSWDLKAMLQKMGITDLFNPNLADLARISSMADLFVTKIIQKAFVHVNEGGVEAAAVTVVEIGARAIPPRRGPTFKADHPFCFFIRDNLSGSILFIGRYANPASEN